LRRRLQRAIHKIIYSVDFFTFNSFNSLPEDYAAEFSKRLSKQSDSLGQPSLFATSAARLRHSALVLHCFARQYSHPTATAAVQFKCAHLCTVFDNGLWVMTYTGQRKQSDVFTQMEQSYLQTNWFPAEDRYFSFSRRNANDSSPLEDFSALLRLAHDNNIELTVVILPVHARLLEMLDYAGLWPYFEYWKRQLVAINEQTASAVDRSPFPIWDFNGYYPVATEPVSAEMNAKPLQWMYDSAHTTVNTGNRILDIIAGKAPADFGGALSSENIDDWLLSQRRLRDAFRREHPLLAKELKKRVNVSRKKSPWTLSPLPASELKIDKLADAEHANQRAGE
jgi:hypothetical protein